jgi:pyruvate,orthophosphate dikinase
MLIAKGQSASPGRATGPLALSAKSAIDFAERGTPAVLVRTEMAAEDVPAIRVAAAIIITRGGITADGAIAARVLGKPCIVGCTTVTLVASKELHAGDAIVREGEALTVDGSSGEIHDTR